MFLPHPRVKVSIVGSLREREVTCSASDRQGSNFESCVFGTLSSQSSHHPQEVLLARFSLYVHKGGLKPDSFHYSLVSWSSCGQLNPLSPHDALKHHFTSLKTDLISQHLWVLERKFLWNWFTNTWQLLLFFKPHQIIFTHYKSRIATAIRGL